jgi:hypothetical protein
LALRATRVVCSPLKPFFAPLKDTEANVEQLSLRSQQQISTAAVRKNGSTTAASCFQDSNTMLGFFECVCACAYIFIYLIDSLSNLVMTC